MVKQELRSFIGWIVMNERPFLRGPMSSNTHTLADDIISKMDKDTLRILASMSARERNTVFEDSFAVTGEYQGSSGFIDPPKNYIKEINGRIGAVIAILKNK